MRQFLTSLWEDVSRLRKVAGENVTVYEYPGMGTIVDASVPPVTPAGLCLANVNIYIFGSIGLFHSNQLYPGGSPAGGVWTTLDPPFGFTCFTVNIPLDFFPPGEVCVWDPVALACSSFLDGHWSFTLSLSPGGVGYNITSSFSLIVPAATSGGSASFSYSGFVSGVNPPIDFIPTPTGPCTFRVTAGWA